MEEVWRPGDGQKMADGILVYQVPVEKYTVVSANP